MQLRLDFNNSFVVDKIGLSGGLDIIWNNDLIVFLLSYSIGHIDLHVHDIAGNVH